MLDVLWEIQDVLFPLLGSFPGDVWNGVECVVSLLSTCLLS